MRTKIKDITGQRFGKLTAIKYEYTKKRHTYWLCKCDCGNEKIVCVDNLRNGSIKSCRCLQLEKAKQSNTTHDMHHTSEYRSWCGIKSRCLNPKNSSYKNYGGRGIKVCDRWFNSFENFYADMGPKPSPKHTLGRIDNDGNYCPENCRWENRHQQNRNKRNNYILEIDEIRHCLSEWSKITGLNRETIKKRLYRGWSPEKAMKTQIKPRERNEKGQFLPAI